MEKNIKKRIEQFSFYDHTGIQKHLEKMAEKGWMIEKITKLYWQYRRIEPQKIYFNVVYFPNVSALDQKPSDNQVMFKEYCEKAGWKHVVSNMQMQIFCSNSEEIVPIETDAELQVETIHKTMKKGFIPCIIALILISLLNQGIYIYILLDNPIDFFTNYELILCITSFIVLSIMCIADLVRYFVWYFKAKRTALQEQIFIASKGSRGLYNVGLITMILVLALYIYFSGINGELWIVLISLLYIIFIVICSLFVRNLIKSSKMYNMAKLIFFILSVVIISMGVTCGIFVLFKTIIDRGFIHNTNISDVPLKLEDFIKVNTEKYEYDFDKKESIFISYIDGYQLPKDDVTSSLPDLKYTFTEVKYGMLYDMCLNYYLNEYNNEDYIETEWRLMNDSSWDAKHVYQEYNSGHPSNNYLICWSDRILEISFYIDGDTDELSNEQKKRIEEKVKEW